MENDSKMWIQEPPSRVAAHCQRENGRRTFSLVLADMDRLIHGYACVTCGLPAEFTHEWIFDPAQEMQRGVEWTVKS